MLGEYRVGTVRVRAESGAGRNHSLAPLPSGLPLHGASMKRDTCAHNEALGAVALFAR